MDTNDSQNTLPDGEKYPHLAKVTATMMGESKEQRVQFALADRFIVHDGVIEALEAMKAVAAGPRGLRPPCAAIIGTTNSGKSALTDKFCRDTYGDHVGVFGPRDVVPVVVVETPERATAPYLALAIARALGLSGFGSARARVVSDNVYRGLTSKSTQVVVLNEFHNVEPNRREERQVVYDFVRGITNHRISVIIVGTEKAKDLCGEDEQLSSRMRVTRVKNFKPDRSFREYLRATEMLIPLPEASNLAGGEMSTAIYKQTSGVVGEVVLLCRGAAKWAIENGRTKIDMEALTKGRPAAGARAA